MSENHTNDNMRKALLSPIKEYRAIDRRATIVEVQQYQYGPVSFG